ncbi:MAG: hypothetical protein Q4A75_09925 [Peptostreptococcaceae bacterium]|nr:hypothetical protein [Peptostreptococcaceae bacterium]
MRKKAKSSDRVFQTIFVPYLSVILFFMAIFLGIYFWINFSYNDLKTLSIRWDIEMPEGIVLEKVYETDPGFSGDADRIFIIDCRDRQTKGSIFNRAIYRAYSKGDLKVIRECYEFIGEENIPRVKNLRKIYRIEHDDDTLIITYDEERERYFIFESIF